MGFIVFSPLYYIFGVSIGCLFYLVGWLVTAYISMREQQKAAIETLDRIRLQQEDNDVFSGHYRKDRLERLDEEMREHQAYTKSWQAGRAYMENVVDQLDVETLRELGKESGIVFLLKAEQALQKKQLKEDEEKIVRLRQMKPFGATRP